MALVAMTVASLASAGRAVAQRYCLGQTALPCQDPSPGLQQALDAASANPGPDTVEMGTGEYSSTPGFVYSDGGDPENALTLVGTRSCQREYGCSGPGLTKSGTGGAVLRFTGGGAARVVFANVHIQVPSGTIGLVMPPNGLASGVSVSSGIIGSDGSVGVMLDGSASKPATLAGSYVYLRPGGGPDVAVEVSNGHGVITGFNQLTAHIGVRSAGTGTVQLERGEIHAATGLSATRARVAGTVVHPTGGTAPVGLEVACPDARAADAQLSVANVTLIGENAPGTTGVVASGRGGDGAACAAGAEITSSIVRGVETTLRAVGDAGLGSAPEPGAAAISARYSDLDTGAVSEEEPAEVNTTSPGQNLDVDPRFFYSLFGPFPRGFRSSELSLRFDSPLIDIGDPAPIEPWQETAIEVVHGRRDVGALEYRFQAPGVQIGADPDRRAGVGAPVTFSASAHDPDDGDPVHVLVQSEDGRSATSEGRPNAGAKVISAFQSPGLYTATATATDPVGLTATDEVSIRVLPAAVEWLVLRKRHFRAARRGRSFTAEGSGAGIGVVYRLFGRVPVRFTVKRAILGRRGRVIRWRPLPGAFTHPAQQGRNTLRFTGRLNGRRLRPGRFRLIAAPAGGGRARAGFRILGR